MTKIQGTIKPAAIESAAVAFLRAMLKWKCGVEIGHCGSRQQKTCESVDRAIFDLISEFKIE